jgi:FkbM family methyltransferase
VKSIIKFILQKFLGYENYLFRFAKYKIKQLHKDPNEADFFHFLKLLENKKGDVIDIGANIGLMTFHLSTKLNQSTVYAIEPINDNIKTLNKVISHFNLKNVQVLPFALGNESKAIEMIVPVQSGAKLQGLSHVKHDSIKDWNEGQHFTVEMKRLDDLQFSNIQGIKMDVENFEYFVLQGGIELLKNERPILYIELWDNDNRKKCFELLQTLNYSIWVVEQEKIIQYNPSVHKTQNFIFQSN